MLNLLTQASWVLAGSAGLVWVGCYFVRTRRLAQEARMVRTEERLSNMIMDDIAGTKIPDETYRQLPLWERHILLRLLKNLADQITGQDQERLVALMQRVGFVDTARVALRSRRAAERQSACVVLGYYDHPAALDSLRGALRDPDLAVRLTAARALLRKDGIESLRALLEDLNFSPDDPPLMMAEIFGLIPARLRPEAIRMLGEPIPDEWKRMLAIALGRSQVLAAYEALVELSRSRSDRMRAAAWIALRELGDPRVGGIVKEGLADANPSVIRAACACAAEAGEPAVIPRLQALLADEDWWVRFSAAQALYDFGPAGRQILEKHATLADEQDVGLLVLREREMEAQYGL
ncbi:MAG TPA: HEAT repeat domain-containing protein [Lacunisphaera sp.]